MIEMDFLSQEQRDIDELAEGISTLRKLKTESLDARTPRERKLLAVALRHFNVPERICFEDRSSSIYIQESIGSVIAAGIKALIELIKKICSGIGELLKSIYKLFFGGDSGAGGGGNSDKARKEYTKARIFIMDNFKHVTDNPEEIMKKMFDELKLEKMEKLSLWLNESAKEQLTENMKIFDAVVNDAMFVLRRTANEYKEVILEAKQAIDEHGYYIRPTKKKLIDALYSSHDLEHKLRLSLGVPKDTSYSSIKIEDVIANDETRFDANDGYSGVGAIGSFSVGKFYLFQVSERGIKIGSFNNERSSNLAKEISQKIDKQLKDGTDLLLRLMVEGNERNLNEIEAKIESFVNRFVDKAKKLEGELSYINKEAVFKEHHDSFVDATTEDETRNIDERMLGKIAHTEELAYSIKGVVSELRLLGIALKFYGIVYTEIAIVRKNVINAANKAKERAPDPNAPKLPKEF